jgi:hypothetical protein
MARWEQLRQERKADADKYYQQMMRAVQADESRDKAQQEYELKKSYYDTRNEKMYQDLQNKSRELDIREFNALVNANFKDMTLQQKERALDIQRELADGRISLMEAQARLNNIKANAGGFAPKSGSRGGRGGSNGEYTIEKTSKKTDARGKTTTTVTTTKKTKGAKNGGKGGDLENTKKLGL